MTAATRTAGAPEPAGACPAGCGAADGCANATPQVGQRETRLVPISRPQAGPITLRPNQNTTFPRTLPVALDDHYPGTRCHTGVRHARELRIAAKTGKAAEA